MAYQERSHVYVVFLIILCEHFILLEWSSFIRSYALLSMATPHNVCAVHRRMFFRLGDIIEYTRGVQYNGGYTEYIGGTVVSVGDIMSTREREMFRTLEGYPEVSIQIQLFSQRSFPAFIMISPSVLSIPRCTAQTLCRVIMFFFIRFPCPLSRETHKVQRSCTTARTFEKCISSLVYKDNEPSKTCHN